MHAAHVVRMLPTAPTSTAAVTPAALPCLPRSMHLGLQNWPLAFTPYGLDPPTRQWLRFLSPERLAIDSDALDFARARLEGGSQGREGKEGAGRAPSEPAAVESRC